MAGFAFVQGNTVTQNPTTTFTITLPSVVAGHSLVFCVTEFSSNALSTVTDSAGATWAKARSDVNTYEGSTDTWYVSSHPGSASTLTVTATLSTNTGTYVTAAIGDFSGAQIGSVRSSGIVDSGSTAVASQSEPVTSVSGDLVVSVQSRYDGAVSGEGPVSPATLIGAITSAGVSITAAWQAATSSSTTIAFNSTASTNISTQSISFAPVAAAPTVHPRLTMMGVGT